MATAGLIRNKNAGVDDLVLLPKITEGDITDMLKKRFEHNIIYTYISSVLLAMNPYQRLPLYGDDQVDLYQGAFRVELPPHIFALAEYAYKSMVNDKHDQCVIISGESGAGKTEASKQIMHYISKVCSDDTGVARVKNIILESNPLLEAFGNAKTLRNNNSSRFGKYFEIKFDRFGNPEGGSVTNYLLEKSRVTYQQAGERSFHIFYQVLSGASAEEKNSFSLWAPENYSYTCMSQCYTVDGIDDRAEYNDTRKAMDAVQIDANTQWYIIQLVSAILHLGNVQFSESANGNSQIADQSQLNLAATVLGVDVKTLQNCITHRIIESGAGNKKEVFNSPLNLEQAIGARDALAKIIYSRLFDWIVSHVNSVLQCQHTGQTIGVLDIYGFEIFQNNGFEQFCINFVNERLQQIFIELTLKAEQDEYVKEGIKWEPIIFFNNKVVCELIDSKRPPGIFSVLDDTCATSHAVTAGIDLKFLEKLTGVVGSHKHFRKAGPGFTVLHYAGEVTYNVEGMCEKNKDTVYTEMIETMQSSSNPFAAQLFPENTKTDGDKKRPTTSAYKIKISCDALVTALMKCDPHYIRCIKSNDNKKPNEFDYDRVKHQCKYLGLLENVKVRRQGFCYRAEFARFLYRYDILCPTTWTGKHGGYRGDAKQGCTLVCQHLQLEQAQWQIGSTKVFLRHPETLFHLEELRERIYNDAAKVIQRIYRKWKSTKHFMDMRAEAQSQFLNRKERRRMSKVRPFTGDYAEFRDNKEFKALIKATNTENPNKVTCRFSDYCQTLRKSGGLLTKKYKPEKRCVVVLQANLYVITKMKNKETKQLYWALERTLPINRITSFSLSTLADNFVVIHSTGEADILLESEKKSEMCIQLGWAKGSQIPITFSDNINANLNPAKKELIQLVFQRENSTKTESVGRKGKMEADYTINPSGSKITIKVPSGLPSSTVCISSAPAPSHSSSSSSKPKPSQPPSRGGSAAGRGGGGSKPPPPSSFNPPPPSSSSAPSPSSFSPPPSSSSSSSSSSRGGMPTRGAPTGAVGGGRGGAAVGAPGGRAPPPPAASKPPPPPAPKKPQARALYAYQAQRGDELNLQVGDVVEVLLESEDGWWTGKKDGNQGVFPSNYVEKI